MYFWNIVIILKYNHVCKVWAAICRHLSANSSNNSLAITFESHFKGNFYCKALLFVVGHVKNVIIASYIFSTSSVNQFVLKIRWKCVSSNIIIRMRWVLKLVNVVINSETILSTYNIITDDKKSINIHFRHEYKKIAFCSII